MYDNSICEVNIIMSIKKTVFAAGLGLVAGFLIKQQIDQCHSSSPENILQKAKETFKKEGPISGSWIYMKPEKINAHGLPFTVYRGGITRYLDGEDFQYEFFADSETGSIISASKLN